CFADPYASWQKGAIENANGLIRLYVPKTESFEHVSHQQITKYSKKINIRPRKKLEFKTPQECFYEQIK
ncbi:transposase InsI of IS30B/C/D, partial [Prevotella nigrescens ATCC 33563]